MSLPPDARRALRLYNFFLPLVFLALLPGLFLRLWRRGGWREKFGQRFARYSEEDRARFASRRWLWLHSISVGETFVALKLAHALHERDPSVGILLSVTTSTGFAEARKAANDWLEAIYNPLDAPWLVRRALDTLRPTQLVLIEGEVWPNLTTECVRRGLPVSLVNARLSPRSERRFRKFRSLTGPIFRLLDRVCVPEPEDVLRWESLGVPREKVIVTGSIKFDNPAITTSREAEFRALLDSLGVAPDAPIIVAGSTWAPEETALANAFLELRRDFPTLFLILVPRHVERTDSILRELSPLGLRIIRRSELATAFSQPSTLNSQLLLVDTTGELRDWYSLATVVFIGKSLPGVAEVGGQNPAEPAVLGKPIVVGPHMENFAALMSQLRDASAIREVPDVDTLTAALKELLVDAAKRDSLGSRAGQTLARHAGATTRTAALLLRC